MATLSTARLATPSTGGPTTHDTVIHWMSCVTSLHWLWTTNCTWPRSRIPRLLADFGVRGHVLLTFRQKVLDIGTGQESGQCSHSYSQHNVWLHLREGRGFADKWPECEVIGTDVSPVQAPWVPENVKFEIDDCTQEWTFEANWFDFVHIRYLLGCIPDWAAFFRQAYKSYEASPNFFSDDGTLPADSATAVCDPFFVKVREATGRSFTVVDDGVQRKAMEEAGFVNIQEKMIKIPSGGWPADPKLRELGIYAQHAVESDVEGFILFLTNVLGWSEEQTTTYISKLQRKLRSLKHHVWYWHKIV